ncbi:hybrid sensor histidine kinase/response regulator [Leptospira bourretii]|uniref:Hybrid sensor histidine kinase/response regulator n=1 Tax=Leptospira bourretii TaxID=2484962 RepID=A0A4V3JL67_9LEPT|nr:MULTISPECIES: response regulator [Leptospira]MCG6140972.1 response regulator [Leptospira mtsangambouensis]TGK84772.1 hybrid sensor histidine kinase/response regulator [Leptospira bourretii]TGK90539.1 hybrid sensor histidine kinase/response regulator [Leptospira bourretii]TGL21577.1 hybrid sensor histidine kinase/response regulator [Leptospira bourretii]TGL26995.1 hybrid sensor histidine kinase/response regulator [Leptospira bourretii]
MVESNVNQSQSSQARAKEHLRRPKEPILIIEDKKENQVLLEAICKRIGMDADVAEDGKIALEMAAKRPYSLYLVDLMMPVLDGKSFIREQKKLEPNAVFMIQTAIDQIDEIIEIMKMGVYDYLLKPLHVEIVADRLEKALEYVYLKRMESLLVDEESKELKSQLEWLNYKESHRKTNEVNSELHSILNLKTTLMQGSGLGAISTIIDSIQQMKVDLGKDYSINKEFWDLLYENHEHNIAMMSGLDLAVDLIQNNTNLVRTKSEDLLGLLPSLVETFRDEIIERELKVNLPVVKQSVFLDLDLESMKVAIHEIFTNGLKYSKRKSHFDVFVTFVDGYFCLSAKNNIIDDEYAKQLAQSEKKLIEPFFRIHPPVESFYSKEKFSLGLGLTMVDFILHRHNGMFFIRNAIDHTTEVKADCIIAEVFLPIQNDK